MKRRIDGVSIRHRLSIRLAELRAGQADQHLRGNEPKGTDKKHNEPTTGEKDTQTHSGRINGRIVDATFATERSGEDGSEEPG